MRRFGMHAVAIEVGGRATGFNAILAAEAVDTDAASELEKVFRREKMEIFTNTSLIGASRKTGSKSVTFHFKGREVEVTAEEIFFALGRIPDRLVQQSLRKTLYIKFKIRDSEIYEKALGYVREYY